MIYPQFFDKVEQIIMKDPLAEFLGACKDGIIEYKYVDIVKLAGHSCPTVAGAYLMTKAALDKLYNNQIPIRGEIKVELKGALDEGVEGVIGNCISFITGAANEGGFKGIGGNFARNNKLFFNSNIEADVRFTRLDNQKSVLVTYDPSTVPPNPKQKELMQKIMRKEVKPEDFREFQKLWQERVEKILLHTPIESIITIREE